MVFYTCSGCGEALKRNKVEKHFYTCNGEYLTCIDCGNDFYGEDYKKHNACITEDQKYSAKGTEFKPNKGDVKQQIWLQNIESAISSDTTLSKNGKKLISNLKHYNNIPRKRAKFLNFLKNSLRIYDKKLGEEVWQVVSNTKSEHSGQNPSATSNTSQENSPDFKESTSPIKTEDPKVLDPVKSYEHNTNEDKTEIRLENSTSDAERIRKKKKRDKANSVNDHSLKANNEGECMVLNSENGNTSFKKKKGKKVDKSGNPEERDGNKSTERKRENENDPTTVITVTTSLISDQFEATTKKRVKSPKNGKLKRKKSKRVEDETMESQNDTNSATCSDISEMVNNKPAKLEVAKVKKKKKKQEGEAPGNIKPLKKTCTETEPSELDRDKNGDERDLLSEEKTDQESVKSAKKKKKHKILKEDISPEIDHSNKRIKKSKMKITKNGNIEASQTSNQRGAASNFKKLKKGKCKKLESGADTC